MGTVVRHKKHGVGKVVELMVDGRTRILFDSGTEHRYKPAPNPSPNLSPSR